MKGVAERASGAEDVRLSREMSGFSVTMIGVGAMIGAGIFVLTGIAAGVAGPGLILAFALNGIVTLFTAMAYAELGSCFHDAGGGYLWVKSSLPHPNGFLSGWMSWFAHAVACSLYALGFGAYFGHVLEGFGLGIPHLAYFSLEKTLAVIACLVFAYINFRGASETGMAGNIVTLAKIAIILLFIGFGAWVMRGMPDWKGNFDPFLPMGIGAVFSAMGLTFIAFQGYEVIAQCSEEVMDPTRNIPRAIFLALLIVIPIYLLVAFVALGAIHGEGMPTWRFLGKMKELAIVEAARQFAPGGGVVVLLGGLLSTASALLATIYSSSRVAFAMSRDHNLPAFLGKVHPEKKTPHHAIVASAVIVVFMALALPIEDVASVADIMFLLVFLQVNVTLIRMRKTHPNLKRGFRVPLVPLVPAIGILTQLFIAVYMFVYSPKAWLSAVVWLVIGFSVYKLYASRTEEEALSVLALAEAEMARKDYRVLVVPFRQEQVRPLMEIACALGSNYKGEVTAVSVIEAPPKVPLSRYPGDLQDARTMLRLAENIAGEPEVDFRRFIKISHRLSHGILETAREEKSNFILVGPLRKDGWVGQFREIVLLNVLEHAPCNVAIFRGEGLSQVRRLLLAIEDNPSCRLAVNIAPALSLAMKVPVTLLHLVPKRGGAAEEQAATAWMEEITRDLPFRLPVEKRVMRSEDIAKSIIEQVRETDLLLMGASRYAGKISSLFTSEVEERVIDGACVPVLLLKRYQQQKSSHLSGILTGR
ncbi:MAG TPA: amino acid permease [Candidatus Deferrimicrobiaceae bacterium]|nr:amino acid permease [Candidatus Deferrimicrobiaceae bacterium]